jgi:hypothetical protein
MKVVKGFEHIVVLIAAITFLLIIMLITIRQAKVVSVLVAQGIRGGNC